MRFRIGGLSVGASVLVVLFLLLLVLLASREARAEGFGLAYGPTFITNDFCDSGTLIVSQEFADRWEADLIVVDEGACWTRQTGLQAKGGLIGAGVQRVFVSRSGKWAGGIGAALWDKDSLFFGDADAVRDDIQFSALLSVERRFSGCWVLPRCSVLWLHGSTAGSTPTNKGLNVVLAFRAVF